MNDTVELIYHPDYLYLSSIDKAKICNGAGAAGDWRSKLIPNTLWGLDCIKAFNIHDYEYHVGVIKRDKLIADVHLLVNLILIIISDGGWFQALRIYRASTYFIAVHLYGDAAFFITNKED